MKESTTFYIMLPGDKEEDCIYESNILGESDINGSFWPGQGLKVLMKITNTHEDLLPEIRIKTDKGKELTVIEFLNVMQKLKLK